MKKKEKETWKKKRKVILEKINEKKKKKGESWKKKVKKR